MNRTLTIPVRAKWFEAIKSGEKIEEYREVKPYWTKRLSKQYDQVEITLGYPAKGDKSRRLRFLWDGYKEVEVDSEEWPGRKVLVYAISLSRPTVSPSKGEQ